MKVGYLRNFSETDPEAREPWAAALWEIRAMLGCSPDVEKCERADKILLAAWASPWLDQSSPKTASQQFAQAVVRLLKGRAPPKKPNTLDLSFSAESL
jgi:hypothetical protein